MTKEFSITGTLDFNNVQTILEDACAKIDSATSDVRFDFSGVPQSNSAGLALLLELLRYTQKVGKTVSFMHLPAKLVAASRISNLDNVLHETL